MNAQASQAGRRILIVDGHSIIFAWPELRKAHARKNQPARETLVKQLTEYQDFSGVHVAVVFDGQGTKVSEESAPGGIQVFFSASGQTADDVIERLVATYGSKHEITVATDDLLERQTAESFGALYLSSEGLRDLLEGNRNDLSRALKARKKRA
ncbi:MAG TPA: NYN domain-containing protein [Chthoniobacteraceae bacterium]|nr:NYN domain-containing protein [Chthoniobacteraceae bacterium]